MNAKGISTRLVSIACLRAMAFGAALTLTVPASAQEQSSAPAEHETESLPLFAILYRTGPNWTPGVPMAEQGLLEHFYYMRDLHQQGRIVLAGPLGEEGGLIILRAANQAEADRMMSADPAVTAGKFVGSVTPFVARFDGTAK